VQGPQKLYRLNRAIAQTGFCARRRADELIAAGRVKVNGKVVTNFACIIDFDCDEIAVDDRPLGQEAHQYVILHKPKGIVTTLSDEKGRPPIVALLPDDLRHLKPVGRLDKDSEGLILLTNDGDMAYQLTHPASVVIKKYLVTVRTGKTTKRESLEQTFSRLTSGIRLTDGMARALYCRIVRNQGSSCLLEIGLAEGKNRQIRRMLAKLGYPVTRLVRVSIGTLQLKEMAAGQWRKLNAREVDKLRSCIHDV
jgi:pseudouridine synthase